ncbi:hypothetical protein VHUM_00141 [Vanrija humicola]|uniref:Rab-GAP TBC domain-containing protein n=1 Tax=Vanrija humicola TaxID=5417 RepID=A0A7D8Z316_VANHU|nr:hypothetical protein VHUM_00141 [Vanrija humicola]
MGDKERTFLSKLDRFGFVNTSTQDRNEDRLALVPAAPLKKVPKLRVRPSVPQPSAPPPIDPTAGGDGNTPSPKLPQSAGPSEAEQSKHRAKERERVEKWMKMMSIKERDSGGNITGWGWSARGDGAKHPTRVYKGIPDRWRMAAWWTLAEGRASKASRMRSHSDLQADYIARRELPSTFDVQIDLDVPRTISGHALFKTRFGRGQRSLFHVLHAFSQSCGTCGYCQGMGSIAATLLCYYEPERTYTLLVRLHDLYDMHGIFAPGFPGLLETFYVQERLIEATMPDVYANFQKHMISSTAWGPKIYITLFVNTVPFNTQLRIWDALFLDGYDVMVCAVLAILWAYRDLLASPKATFESILSLLSSFYVPEDEDALLNWIRRFLWAPGTRDRIQFWRREWRGLVAQDQHHDRLL